MAILFLGLFHPAIFHLFIFELVQSDTSNSAVCFVFNSWKCRLSIRVRAELHWCLKIIFKPFFSFARCSFLSIVVAVLQTKEIIQQTDFVTNNGTEVLSLICKREFAKRQCLHLTMKNVIGNNNFEKIRRCEFLLCQKYVLSRTIPL